MCRMRHSISIVHNCVRFSHHSLYVHCVLSLIRTDYLVEDGEDEEAWDSDDSYDSELSEDTEGEEVFPVPPPLAVEEGPRFVRFGGSSLPPSELLQASFRTSRLTLGELIAAVVNLQTSSKLSERAVSGIYSVLRSAFPADHNLPSDYKIAKQLNALGSFHLQSLDMCTNGCCCFGLTIEKRTQRNRNERCRTCEAPRYRKLRPAKVSCAQNCAHIVHKYCTNCAH